MGGGSALAVLTLSFLVLVGFYALIKGEVSEKLALRQGAALGARPTTLRHVGQLAPRGLDDPRLDFSPKEEDEPGAGSTCAVLRRLALHWAEGMGGGLAFFAAWGVARDRYLRRVVASPSGDGPSPVGRGLLGVFLALFCAVLTRHVGKLGYLSDRHTLTLAIASLPWAAAGVFLCARGVAVWFAWEDRRARRLGMLGVLVLVAIGIEAQCAKPPHPSRWGHWAAGEWLRSRALASEAVLDTRGWAWFLSGRPGYDYWHVRQAFTDAHLSYIVVGTGELGASSKRAGTLRAVLAHAATPVVEFPERADGKGGAGVRIYRFHRPDSWEGLVR